MGINILQPSRDADPAAKRAKQVIELIEDMRDDFNTYDFGKTWQFLDDVYDQASRTGGVTEAQLQGVVNIKARGESRQEQRRDRYSPRSRRYD